MDLTEFCVLVVAVTVFCAIGICLAIEHEDKINDEDRDGR
jgi:hypothetical protein